MLCSECVRHGDQEHSEEEETQEIVDSGASAEMGEDEEDVMMWEQYVMMEEERIHDIFCDREQLEKAEPNNEQAYLISSCETLAKKGSRTSFPDLPDPEMVRDEMRLGVVIHIEPVTDEQ